VNHTLLPLEEGTSSYSVEELEKWTWQRGMAQDVLDSKLQARLSSRFVDYGDLYIDSPRAPLPYLLPGGRWFLIAQPSASMYAFDLDSIKPYPKFLFNPLDFDPELESEFIRYTYWVDHLNPCLSFYVAANAYNKGQSSPVIFHAGKLMYVRQDAYHCLCWTT
jgi:hypothetical protein